jgi:hypothetical protein
VLLICHKAVEALARSFDPRFGRFEIAHWGALDGRNDWQDFDTCVIAGLSFRDEIYANNLVFGLTGLPEDDGWLERPKWGGHNNVREVIRCRSSRRSIASDVGGSSTKDGNCLPADVFILLPSGSRGDQMLQAIRREMPGIRESEWTIQLDGPRPKSVRKGTSGEALITFMRNAPPGEFRLSDIRQALDVSPKIVEKWQEALRDKTHPLTATLLQMGVVYDVRGAGRGAKSHLVKLR